MKMPTLYLKLAMPLLAASFSVLAEPPLCITEQQQLQQSLLHHPPIDPAVMNAVLSLQHEGISLCRTGNVTEGAAKLNEALKKNRPLVPPQLEPTTFVSANASALEPSTSMQSTTFGYTGPAQTENYTIQMITDGFFDVNRYSLSESGQVAYCGSIYDNNVYKGSRAFRWESGTLTNLGTLGTDSDGYGWSCAAAINASGQVAGWGSFYDNNVDKGTRAIRWEVDGTLTNLGSLGTDSNGYGVVPIVLSINAGGQVVGESYFYDNNEYKGSRVFLSNADGTLTNLGSLGTDSNGYGEGRATAINASGQAAGGSRFYANNEYKGSRAFRSKTDGTLINLGSLGTDSDGYGDSFASAINASGQVAGLSQFYDNNVNKGSRAFLWEVDGTLINLGSLGTDSDGNGYSSVSAMNASGQVIGSSAIYDNNTYNGFRAFISESGQPMKAIPLLDECADESNSYANDLNDQGQVVGYSPSGVNSPTLGCIYHAVLYDIATQTLSDLNDLLPAHFGWWVDTAIAINEAGQILVDIRYEDDPYQPQLALLSPVQDAPPKVLYPNGGETLKVGSKVILKWHPSNTLVNQKQRVTVLFSKNSGESWSEIRDGIKNTGFFQWKPNKNDQTTQGRIKVCQSNVNTRRPPSPPVCDESDADFRIEK